MLQPNLSNKDRDVATGQSPRGHIPLNRVLVVKVLEVVPIGIGIGIDGIEIETEIEIEIELETEIELEMTLNRKLLVSSALFI